MKLQDRLIAWLRKLNIRTRILFTIIAGIIVFSILFSALAVITVRTVVGNYTKEYIESYQKHVADMVETTMINITNIYVRIVSNQRIYSILRNEKYSTKEKQDLLEELFAEIQVDSHLIGGIQIYDHKNILYSIQGEDFTNSVPERTYLREIEENTGNMPTWGELYMGAGGKYYYPYAMKLRNFNTGTFVGHIILYINQSAFQYIYQAGLPSWQAAALVDREGQIVSYYNFSDIGTKIDDFENLFSESFTYTDINYRNQRSIIAVHPLSKRMGNIGLDWKIVNIMPYSELFNTLPRIYLYLLLIAIALIVIISPVSIFISRRIALSIERLKNNISIFSEDPFAELEEPRTGDEIEELNKDFDMMVKTIRELIVKNDEEKEKQRELEFIALQAQINPHFLYNTLDTIGWIARIEDQPLIDEIVQSLADFYRLSLSKGQLYISVEREVELVKNYVRIEMVKNPGKFTVDYRIDRDILEYKTIKILLQPLVENAIKHGVLPKNGKGHIKISIYPQDGDIVFEVEDDGVGFDLDNPASDILFGFGGYGLHNINERLQIEYGPEYKAVIKSRIGIGTLARVRIKKSM